MNVLVCIKPAPPGSAIDYAKDSGRPCVRDSLRLSNGDAAALQFALELRASHGGAVTVVSAGGERVETWLRHCLDQGADRALRIDHAPADATPDTARAARLVAAMAGIERMDLVLCASRSADIGSGYFPYALAEAAGLRVLSRVVEVHVEAREVTVVRRLERGWRERYRLRLPLLLAVEEDLRAPRHVALFSASHRHAMRRAIEVVQPAPAIESSTTALVAVALELPQPRRRPRAQQRSATSARDRLRRKPLNAVAPQAPAQPGGDADALAAQLIVMIRKWLDTVADEPSA